MWLTCTAGVASWISEVLTSPVASPDCFASSSNVGYALPLRSIPTPLS